MIGRSHPPLSRSDFVCVDGRRIAGPKRGRGGRGGDAARGGRGGRNGGAAPAAANTGGANGAQNATGGGAPARGGVSLEPATTPFPFDPNGPPVATFFEAGGNMEGGL